MSTSLENIWDEPISSSNAQPTTPAPVEVVDSDDEGPSTTAKRRSSKLFLSSDSEGEQQPKSKQRQKPSRDLSPDIAAIFDDLEGPDDDDDGFQELAPALDIASLRKDADARAANTVQLKIKPIVERSATTGGDDDYGAAVGKKSQKSSGLTARRPIARLDETRLLGPEGFPLLVKRAKTFKPKGKGHEETDLNRLLQMYNFWSHEMFPKGHFKDNVQRIEKLCHSKRMHVALSVWHDESKGLVNGRKIDDPIDLTSESENEDGDEQEPKNAEDTQVSDRPHSSPPPIPPSSASEYNSMTEDDDVDMDALIREDEERLTSSADMTTNHRNDTFHGVPDVTDEDEAMWAQLDADFDDLTTPSLQATSKPFVPPPPPAEDEDMWDIVREMEMEEVTNNAKTTRSAHPPPEESMTPVAEMRGTTPVRKATNDEGWDEMYAEIDPE